MKRYICAIAFSKAEALKRAGYYSQDIIEHMIKILLYSDIRPEDVDHWISEIATWLKSVDRLTVKPSNKPLKKQDIRDTTFAPMGDSLEDYKDSLEMFQRANKKGKFNYETKESYPEVKITAELADDLMNACYSLMDQAIPMISNKAEHSREDFARVVENCFK